MWILDYSLYFTIFCPGLQPEIRMEKGAGLNPLPISSAQCSHWAPSPQGEGKRGDVGIAPYGQ